MKTIRLTALLLAVLLLALPPLAGCAPKEEPVVGGWGRPGTPDVPDTVRDALAAAEGGAAYTALALISEQVVAGFNYRLLCTNADGHYVLLVLYVDPSGRGKITSTFVSANTESVSELIGGWRAPESPAIPDELAAAFSEAVKPLDTNYVPLALLAQQVVAGMNYAFFCEVNGSSYAFVTVYVNLKGEASFSSALPFDGTAQ